MIPIIVGLSIALVRGFDATFWRWLAPTDSLSRIVHPIAVVVLVALAHLVYLAIAPFLFRFEHMSPFRRIGYATFTARSPRYRFPGFRPPRR